MASVVIAATIWLVPYLVYGCTNLILVDWLFVWCDPGKNLFGLIGTIVPYCIARCFLMMDGRAAIAGRFVLLMLAVAAFGIVVFFSAAIANPGQATLGAAAPGSEHSIPYPADYSGPGAVNVIDAYKAARGVAGGRASYLAVVADEIRDGRLHTGWVGWLGWSTTASSIALAVALIALALWRLITEKASSYASVAGGEKGKNDFDRYIAVAAALYVGWLLFLAPISYKYTQLQPGWSGLSFVLDWKTHLFTFMASCFIAIMCAKSNLPLTVYRAFRLTVATLMVTLLGVVPDFPPVAVLPMSCILLATYAGILLAVYRHSLTNKPNHPTGTVAAPAERQSL